ncbi:MAG: FtsX-like permease family protein [Armatimonadota bacterium]
MLELKLAYRNLIGAGLRTWLNVIALSFAYVIIIWHQGLFFGMLEQSTRDMVNYEIGSGQYWHKTYDPYDAISLDDAHGVIPSGLKDMTAEGKAAPVLIRPASIFPHGRLQSVLLKGIDPAQQILKIPTSNLTKQDGYIPVLIGQRMARANEFKVDDYITIRFRDANGTFDAVDGKIVWIMETNVPTVDKGQLWIPLEDLQKIMVMPDEATIVVAGKGAQDMGSLSDWEFKSQSFLLKDITEMIKSKRISASIMYVILLFLAMLAVFDTQVLSIFRRRKEIGTMMALGLTRARVILTFTLEGVINGVLAIVVGAAYGIPLLWLTAIKGFNVPHASDAYGFAISQRLFPVYPIALILGTVIIVMITVTIVSYLPAKQISKLKPTDALRGKIS